MKRFNFNEIMKLLTEDNYFLPFEEQFPLDSPNRFISNTWHIWSTNLYDFIIINIIKINKSVLIFFIYTFLFIP